MALSVEVIHVDTMKKCGTMSNLDLVKFIWDFNTFSFLKYATCMKPTTSTYVVFLRHYRAESDGWLNRARCDDCLALPKQLVAEQVGCKASNNCTCSICIKQPATLKDTSSNVIFTMVFNLDKFQIAAGTVYQHLAHTRTKSLPAERLVKFDVSQLTARYVQFDKIPKTYFHTECAPTGQQNGHRWICKRQQPFDDADDFHTEITVNGYKWWCAHCYKPVLYASMFTIKVFILDFEVQIDYIDIIDILMFNTEHQQHMK